MGATRGLVIVALLALGASGCGDQDREAKAPAPAQRAASPAKAVEQFARAVGKPGRDETRAALKRGCRLLSPEVRAGMRFQASVRPSDDNCAAALSLSLFYAGDTGDLPRPSSLRVAVRGQTVRGRQAVVDVRVTFATDEGPRAYPTKVMVVRGAGGWAVATPQTLGILTASRGVSDADVTQAYQRLRAAAGQGERQVASGRAATSRVTSSPDRCPGATSGGQDPTGDVRFGNSSGADGQPRPPASTDLVEVRHGGDGSDLCFALRFADSAPAAADVEVRLRPRGRAVTVTWTANGRAVGERRGADDDEAEAVPVRVARAGDRVAIRVPRAALGAPDGGYRWAIQCFVRTPDRTNAYMDTVPQDMTIEGDGSDSYVPHP